MMRRLWAVLLTLLIIQGARADGPESLFNGKDLTGWTGDPKLWSVENGAITGRTDGQIPQNSFLIWDGTAGDFELRLQFRIEGGNSGIQYRSRLFPDIGPYSVGGYQADIDAAGKYTGILYEERGRGILAERGQNVEIDANGNRAVTRFADGSALLAGIDQKNWNEYVITAVGPTLTHTINGRKTIEVIDQQTDKRSTEGKIALQLHRGEPMVVQFKDIQLKRLSGAKDAPAAAQPAWIWAGAGGEHQSAFLRRGFELRAPIATAKLILAADDAATVFIDGRPVLSNSRWSDPAFKDVTSAVAADDQLGVGKHVLAVKARNEMSAAGVLVQLRIDSRTGESLTIQSDSSWKALDHEPIGWERADFDDAAWPAATVVSALGAKPRDAVTAATLSAVARMREPTATPPDRIKIAKDFQVELLYSVPKDKQGSWVNMGVDPKGRLYVSDQYGGLFRITPPPIGGKPDQTQVEPVPVELGEAQGLLWAFDSLYVVVNRGSKYQSGLYRVRDTNGDDRLDSVELLRKLDGDGEHGPHAVILAPDGQSLFVLCGNQTKMTELAASRVPKHWGEDHLLPRMPDGRGFMAGVLGPGGCIYQVDRDGKDWTLFSTGFRNPFDIAFNRDGELFTYDADMEWDISTPWYRPTRICHVSSGSEFGWRNGSGKWPPHYPDSLPAILDIGPGSPTGICFGYGAKFPARYQDALFICDWSYGKLYAVHLTPRGSTYTATFDEFLNGNPLPLTDVVINPHDGAMYFTIGGRKTKSGLYRVTYTGAEPVVGRAPNPQSGPEVAARAARHALEDRHLRPDPAAIDSIWKSLGDPDRFIRSAARVALEQIAPTHWAERALAEHEPGTAIAALLALVRVSADDPQHHPKDARPVDPALKSRTLAALSRIDWNRLGDEQRIDLLRTYQILFVRMGQPSDSERSAVLSQLDGRFPAASRETNAMLCEILVFLTAPHVAERALHLLEQAPTQEEQLEYAKSLRVLRDGWTPDLRRRYFEWFARAARYSGGMSFQGFMENIKKDALAVLSDAERSAVEPILAQAAQSKPAPATPPRPFVRKWTVADFDAALASGLKDRDFDRGRTLFGAASCFSCHRFANEGGAQGPDLTQSAGRFSPRDLLESIIEPSKEISDQYAAVRIDTVDGKVITGRIVNLNGDTVTVLPNMLEPNKLVTVDVRRIESQQTSKVSMMPESLLDTLAEDEILDLLAYTLSRGERRNGMFRK